MQHRQTGADWQDSCAPAFPSGPEGMGQEKGDVKTAFPNLLNVGLNPAPTGFNHDPVIEQIFEGWIPDDKITKAKRFVVERRNYVLYGEAPPPSEDGGSRIKDQTVGAP